MPSKKAVPEYLTVSSTLKSLRNCKQKEARGSYKEVQRGIQTRSL
jgi:hypothetical protein